MNTIDARDPLIVGQTIQFILTTLQSFYGDLERLIESQGNVATKEAVEANKKVIAELQEFQKEIQSILDKNASYDKGVKDQVAAEVAAAKKEIQDETAKVILANEKRKNKQIGWSIAAGIIGLGIAISVGYFNVQAAKAKIEMNQPTKRSPIRP